MSVVINVNETIDRHPITAYQIGVLTMCMLVAALDGYDSQAIGYTAPAIAQLLHLPPNALGPVFSAALLGGALGALSFGPLADRLGRKRFMVAATIIFAAFSFLTGRVTSLPELLACHFITGLGLGGGSAEIRPSGACRRHRMRRCGAGRLALPQRWLASPQSSATASSIS